MPVSITEKACEILKE